MSFSAVIGLLFLAALVVSLPVALAVFSKTGKDTSDSAGKRIIGFFQVPYVTWFLLHLVIASTGIIAVVILGIAGVIDKGTVAALLGSLFGYVLGAVSVARNASDQRTTAPSPGVPTISKVDTKATPTQTIVTLVGTNLDQVTAIALGNVPVPAGGLNVITPQVAQVSVPAPALGAPAPPAAPIVLTLASGATLTTTTNYP